MKELVKLLLKFKKKIGGGEGWVWWGGGGVGGVRVDVNREVKLFCGNSKKNIFFFVGGGGGSGWM